MLTSFRLIGLNCRYTHSNLALFYVRHALERNIQGCRVTIDQYTINDPYYDTLVRISGCDAEALFISVYIWNAQYVYRLIHDLARIDPDRPIILGGPEAPSLGALPRNCSLVLDEVEGLPEDFFIDLTQANMKTIYRAEAGNPFPFPYRDEDFKSLLQNRNVYYESSRGCPFRCSYCLSAVGRKVGHKDVQVVKEELEQILTHQPKIIKFVDRTFNDNPDRAVAIWQFLIKHPGETRFHFEIAPDRFTEEMFKLLETVGPDRFQFEIGIQSTNPETLAAINRKMDVDLTAENIERLLQLDTIHLHADLILGLPFETKESFRNSFNRIFALEPHYIQMGLLKVLPDTPISSQVYEHGMMYCHQPPYQVLATRWLNHQELSRLYRMGELIESFYNNRYFRTIWKYLNRTGEEPFTFFEDLLEISEEKQFLDRSHTQELLAGMLSRLAEKRPDRALLMDLLRYDWLCCGHRFLPPFLEEKPLAVIRAAVREALPPSMDGRYDSKGRSEFLKRGVFLEISSEVLRLDNFNVQTGQVHVCFLSEKTTGVIKRSRVVLLEGVA